MAFSGFAAQGADQIYQSGPESLALEATAIVAGPVSGYTKQVISSSRGTAPIPLTWSISGRIDQVRILKGASIEPGIPFVRQERSLLVPPDTAVPEWYAEYDNLEPGDLAVLFLTGDPANPQTIPLPSGSGPRDLAGLLSEIVPIQAVQDHAAQTDAWLHYLATARSDQGRKAALRSLVSLNVTWAKLAPTVEFLMGGSGPAMRVFIFGIVAFAVMKEKFGPQQLDATDFLGRQFVGQADPDVALGYVLNLKLLLSFTSQTAGRASRAPLEARIVSALKRRAAAGPLPPELGEQYRQIQASYPGLL